MQCIDIRRLTIVSHFPLQAPSFYLAYSIRYVYQKLFPLVFVRSRRCLLVLCFWVLVIETSFLLPHLRFRKVINRYISVSIECIKVIVIWIGTYVVKSCFYQFSDPTFPCLNFHLVSQSGHFCLVPTELVSIIPQIPSLIINKS